MTNTSGDQQPTAPSSYPSAWAAAPAHSGATASMIVGSVALALSCGYGLSLLAAPVAWWLGSRALHEIDASGGRLSGRAMAQAGVVTGVIGTVLLVIAVLAVVAFFVFVFAFHGSTV